MERIVYLLRINSNRNSEILINFSSFPKRGMTFIFVKQFIILQISSWKFAATLIWIIFQYKKVAVNRLKILLLQIDNKMQIMC